MNPLNPCRKRRPTPSERSTASNRIRDDWYAGWPAHYIAKKHRVPIETVEGVIAGRIK